jgi:hypothetical protein
MRNASLNSTRSGCAAQNPQMIHVNNDIYWGFLSGVVGPALVRFRRLQVFMPIVLRTTLRHLTRGGTSRVTSRKRVYIRRSRVIIIS